MHEYRDLEHFVLRPDETLILRPRKVLSLEQMERMAAYLNAKLGQRVLLLPTPDFDIMGATLQDLPQPVVDPLSQEGVEQAEAAYEEMTWHYANGRIIEYMDVNDECQQWCQAHRFASPHNFDPVAFRYRLPTAK